MSICFFSVFWRMKIAGEHSRWNWPCSPLYRSSSSLWIAMKAKIFRWESPTSLVFWAFTWHLRILHLRTTRPLFPETQLFFNDKLKHFDTIQFLSTSWVEWDQIRKKFKPNRKIMVESRNIEKILCFSTFRLKLKNYIILKESGSKKPKMAKWCQVQTTLTLFSGSRTMLDL